METKHSLLNQTGLNLTNKKTQHPGFHFTKKRTGRAVKSSPAHPRRHHPPQQTPLWGSLHPPQRGSEADPGRPAGARVTPAAVTRAAVHLLADRSPCWAGFPILHDSLFVTAGEWWHSA